MTPTTYSFLVVDDNEDNSDILASRLQREGHQVAIASDGKQALAMVNDQSFDLILLDIEMPGMNGLEVLINVRQSRTMTDLPIIVVSGRDQTGDMVAAMKLGANDYVTKPLNFPIVMARIQTHLAMKKSHAGLTSRPDRVLEPQAVAAAGSPAKAPATVCPAPVAAGTRHSTDAGDSPSARTWQKESESSISRSGAPVTQQAAAPAHSSPTGDRMMVAGYELVSELGRGGMGVVYKARHLKMNRVVALKVIDREHLQHSNSVSRFYKEIEAAGKLSHPNIVMAFDAGQVCDTCYFAMEYVDGVDLGKLLKQSGPLPVQRAVDWLRQAALGLQHVHEKGLVHRDIKPSNLMATWTAKPASTSGSGVVRMSAQGASRGNHDTILKILDLGLAMVHQPTPDPAAQSQEHLTREGRTVGTADYMAPEQWKNPHDVDIRADLYSLGCTFYHLLTGQVPYPGREVMAKMLRHHMEEPAPLSRLRPTIPIELRTIIRRLMAKLPKDRYRTPGEVVEALH